LTDTHRTDASVRTERAILAALLDPVPYDDKGPGYDPLGELRALAEAAGAVVIDQLVQYRLRPVAGTFIGKGKVEELAALVAAQETQVVIFDNDLSPSQIRNIEAECKCKVLDRSELILDIFAGRARTHEAKLQVELAQLEYTYPRLAGMWTHLERIGAGAGVGIGTRGPGETQIETDRRIVQTRKADLRRELERIQSRKQREVKQRNIDFFTVGLVGYTNAGKSTLFNTLTDAGVNAEDKLFATLDTRTRRWELGSGDTVMLSDTVGFVRDLPHHLVASFRATLEESIHSDLLLIVLDISDPHAEQHLETVDEVLEQVGAVDQKRLLLLNKIDRLHDNAPLLLWQQQYPESIAVSAARGLGLDKVVDAVRSHHRGGMMRLKVRLPMREGKAMHFLENRAEVRQRDYDTDSVTLTLSIGKRQLDQLRATGARFEVIEDAPRA
jgi:GTP-binding protein HflX